MHHASPVWGWVACRMRYSTGSRRLRLPDVMSIRARSTCAPSGNSPPRILANSSALSSAERFRHGLCLPGTGEGAPRLPDLGRRLTVHVGEPGPDEATGVAVHLLEVVRSVPRLALPSEAEPAHVVLDRDRVLATLLEGVGVVEAKPAKAPGLPRDPEIEAHRLRVADVQIPVRLGREPGHRRASTLRHIGGHDAADEVGWDGGIVGRVLHGGAILPRKPHRLPGGRRGRPAANFARSG